MLAIPGLPGLGRERAATDVDDRLDRNAVFFREREISLVVRGHAHDGAFPIGHQDVVADPDRHVGAAHGMAYEQTRRDALFLLRRERRLDSGPVLAFFDEGGELRIAARRMRGERMLSGDRAKRHAHDRVGARREHAQAAGRAIDLVGERDVDALAPADPVRLHGTHALGPTRHGIQRGEQILGVLRDLQVIHRDLAFLDESPRAPTAAVDDLLVREHGLIDGIPIDLAGLAVGNTLLEHAQEQPLVPAVILGTAGRELARPIESEAERLELLLHVGDVAVGPLRRRHTVGHCGVFRRQAEGVPTHGLEHVLAVHAHEAGEHVADRVIAHVAHVAAAARVREHRETVVLLPCRIFLGFE